MYNNTFIISLEGKDRLGKTTQCSLLQSKIENSIVQKIPNKDGITFEKIYEMLKNGDALKSPYYFQSLNAHNRLLWQKQNLPLICSMYSTVILDRWNLSSYVYGKITGISDEDLNIMLGGLIEPDLYIIFDGESFDMLKEKDSYEENNVLQDKVRDLYLSYVDNEKIVKINANQNKEDITEQILVEFLRVKKEIENGKRRI